jgi:ribonucleoside-diphosphate reductase alpha chain
VVFVFLLDSASLNWIRPKQIKGSFMLLASDSVSSAVPSMLVHQDSKSVAPSAGLSLDQYKVIRRNGSVVAFEPSKISIAVTKAFIAVNGGQGAASARVRELVEQLTADVVNALVRRQPHGGTTAYRGYSGRSSFPDALRRADVARAYVLYREQRVPANAARVRKRPKLPRC